MYSLPTESLRPFDRTELCAVMGTSNFYQNHLDLLLEVCQEDALILPIINQIEIHPDNLEL